MGTLTLRDTVNERAVRIVLEYIPILFSVLTKILSWFEQLKVCLKEEKSSTVMVGAKSIFASHNYASAENFS